MTNPDDIQRLEHWIGQQLRERTQEELERLRSLLWENLMMDSQTIHKRDITQASMDLITPKELDSIFNRPSFFSMGFGFSVFKLHDLYVPPIVISTPEDNE